MNIFSRFEVAGNVISWGIPFIHKALKEMLTKFCHSNSRDWEEGVPVALYAICTARPKGLGYCPFELMFGRRFREKFRLVC